MATGKGTERAAEVISTTCRRQVRSTCLSWIGSTLVPWEAPSGTYPLGLYGVDAEGNRGPAVYASYKVL